MEPETWEALKVAMMLALGLGGCGIAVTGVLMLMVRAILGPEMGDGPEDDLTKD